MTIAVACPCGGRFAAQPHLAGKTVRCPNCQQPLRVPEPSPGPLAPIVNPFSDDAGPIDAQLVPPVAPAALAAANSQDPFGGRATVDPTAAQPAAPYPPGRPAAPPSYPYSKSPSDSPYHPSESGARKSSRTIFFVIAAALFGVFGFLFVAGLGVYQFLQELGDISLVEGPTPLTVRDEDYAEARRRFATKLTTRGEAPQDWIPLETPAGAADLSYTSGGHTLRAFVDPPPADGGPRPGVVFLHGGFAWGDGDWEMPQPYRDQGFIVMSPILRAENGQPGNFSLYFDEVDDVLAATSAFAELPYVDDSQLFIAGHSAGGTLATLTALTTDRFQAMASFSGMTNMDGMEEWDDEMVVYDPADEDEVAMRSPEAFAKSFKCPGQLFYGSQEDWMAEMLRRTAKTATLAGKHVQAIMVPGDHLSAVRPAISRSIVFFRQHGSRPGQPVPSRVQPSPPRAMPPEFSSPAFTPPEPPKMPDLSTPRMPIPPAGIPGRTGGVPNRGAPRRPQFPTMPPAPPGMHQGIVTFEVVDYSGRVPQMISARRALIRSPWADTARITIDESAGTITVPARRRLDVKTEQARQELERVGFTIGTATFRSSTGDEAGQ